MRKCTRKPVVASVYEVFGLDGTFSSCRNSTEVDSLTGPVDTQNVDAIDVIVVAFTILWESGGGGAFLEKVLMVLAVQSHPFIR
jgi:hypothetical protein